MTNCPLPPTLANCVGSVLSHSLNSGHTVTLRSAQIAPFGRNFVCPHTLYEMALFGIIKEVEAI